jgi:hypothetical protein
LMIKSKRPMSVFWLSFLFPIAIVFLVSKDFLLSVSLGIPAGYVLLYFGSRFFSNQSVKRKVVMNNSDDTTDGKESSQL